jgi:hypothetical protein
MAAVVRRLRVSMLDADANQLLTRADELASAGRGQDAASACESAGDLLLGQGNVLGAAVAYQRALHQLTAEFLPRAQKSRISERLGDALGELGMASGLTRERRVECLFRAGARYWSDKPSPARGQRGVCFRCGELKVAGWSRCSACSTLPALSEDVAVSLLLSERVCPFERLQELGRRVHLGEEAVPQDVNRLFATALYQSSAGHAEPVGQLLPGTVASVAHMNRRSAVLLEVSTSSDSVTEKPACAEFIQSVCMGLLEAAEPVVIDELTLGDGRAVHDVNSDLLRRFGAKVHFERWQRIHVERGCLATAVVGAGVSAPRESRPHRVRPCGNLVVAAVALATPELELPNAAVHDLAGQLALQAATSHLEQRFPQDLAEPSQTLCVSLALEPFACDPSLSVAGAIEVLRDALSSEVSLEAVVCYARRRFVDDDPSHFPGEAAMHG